MLRRELRKIRQYCLWKESSGDVDRLLTDQTEAGSISLCLPLSLIGQNLNNFIHPTLFSFGYVLKAFQAFYMVFMQGEVRCSLNNLSDCRWHEYTQPN